jgi:hypothetical protein
MTATARMAMPTTPRNRDASIDLNTFDSRLVRIQNDYLAKQEAAARAVLISRGAFDLLEVLGLDPLTEAEREALAERSAA